MTTPNPYTWTFVAPVYYNPNSGQTEWIQGVGGSQSVIANAWSAALAAPALVQVDVGNKLLVSSSLGSAATVAPSDTVAVASGAEIAIVATVAGNVKLALDDASTITVPVAVGLTRLSWRVTKVFVTGTTATATYYNLS